MAAIERRTRNHIVVNRENSILPGLQDWSTDHDCYKLKSHPLAPGQKQDPKNNNNKHSCSKFCFPCYKHTAASRALFVRPVARWPNAVNSQLSGRDKVETTVSQTCTASLVTRLLASLSALFVLLFIFFFLQHKVFPAFEKNPKQGKKVKKKSFSLPI